MATANGGLLTPTEEGRWRYPRTFGYHPTLSDEPRPDPDRPCTCSAPCQKRCAGECGCLACSLAFALFCAEGPFGVSDDFDEEQALAAYSSGDYL